MSKPSITQKPSKVRALAVALLSGSALVAAACGSSTKAASSSSASSSKSTSAKAITITFENWADDETATEPGIRKAVAEYEKLNPNVTIKLIPVSYSNDGHQLLLEYRSGDAPDVAETQGNYTAALAYAGALQPLQSYAGSLTSKLDPAAVKIGEYSGKLDAIPWTIAPFGFWYNKVLLKKATGSSTPPSTVAQLETDMAAIKSKLPGVLPFGFDTTNRSFGLDINTSFMRDFGAVPFTETSSKLGIETPAFTHYLEFIRLLGHDGYDVPNQLQGHFRPILADGKVVFVVDGPYLQGVVQDTNHMTDSEFYKTYGVTVIPSGSNGKHYSVPTDHQLVMFKSAKHKKAVWAFMKWLATSPTAIKLYTIPYEDSLPPLTKPAASYASMVDTPPFKAFADKIEPTVIRPPWGPKYSEAYSPIMAGVQEAMTTSTPLSTIESTIVSRLKTAFSAAG